MSRREEALRCIAPARWWWATRTYRAELQLRRQAGESGALLARYLPRCRAAGIRVLIGAVYVHPSYLPEMALRTALAQIGALLAEIKESRHAFQLVKDAAELDAALADGRIAVLLAMEGTEPLCGSAELLLPFYTLGVRLLGLTWNGRTQAADGCGLPGARPDAFRQRAGTGSLVSGDDPGRQPFERRPVSTTCLRWAEALFWPPIPTAARSAATRAIWITLNCRVWAAGAASSA